MKTTKKTKELDKDLESIREAAEKSVKVSRKMSDYLKKHKLDPDKDWSKHPVHGEKISRWLKIIRIAEEKGKNTPLKLKKPETKPKVKEVRNAPTVYDYPDIDGMPMPSNLRKRYRQKMRDLLKARVDVNEAKRQALETVSKSKIRNEAEKKAVKVSTEISDTTAIVREKNNKKYKKIKKVNKTSMKEED